VLEPGSPLRHERRAALPLGASLPRGWAGWKQE